MIDINIDFKEAIEKYKIKDLIVIEQKLYLISLFLDNAKTINVSYLTEKKEITIFKEITFIIKKLSNTEDVIKFAGNNYRLSQFKRIINFIDDNQEKIFVYNSIYFKKKLKEKKFLLFEYSGTNKTIDSKDSLKSELNETEITNVYTNETITEIKKIETNTKKILEKFGTKSDYPYKISDLSLNMKYYNNITLDNDIEYYEDLITFKNDKILNKFIYDNFASILYFYGPKGCGKTTRLLFSSLDIHNCSDLNYPRLYIDFQVMKENSLLRKLIFKQEMFYMAQTVEELEGLFNLGYHKQITETEYFFEFLKVFLENIIKLNIFKTKKIIVLIDNYDDDENYTKNNNYLEEIIEFSKKNSEMIKLIISGNGLFIKAKQKLFINNKLSDSIASNHQKCLECSFYDYNSNQNIKKNIIPEYIFTNPEYYYKFISQKLDEKNITEFTNSLIQEESDLCEKINFFGQYYSLIFENKELSYEAFNKYYDILPNFYLSFIKKPKTISFKISNKIFKGAIKKTLEYDIEVNSIKNLLQLNNKESTQIGIYEEKLLTLFFKLNKLNLANLQFVKENILEIEEIYEFINSKYDRYNGNIKKDNPLIITQSNYKGKNYDLLILIPLENSNNYVAIFIQIGLNKIKADIVKLVDDILNNHKKFKDGIEKYLGINIKDIYLNFIFDKQTQQNNIENGINSCGSNYCLSQNIKFYLFSLEDYRLYKLNNDMSCEKITNYEYNAEKENFLGNKRMKFSNSMFIDFYNILDEDEIEKLIILKPIIKNISKYSVNNISSSSLFQKRLYKNHLYIFTDYNSDFKLFGIDGKLKKFSNGTFLDYFSESLPENAKIRIYDIPLT